MNFKPTLLKTIVSIISGIVANYFFGGKVMVLCMLDANDPYATCPQPSWIEHAFDPVPIVISLLVIGIVYSIWSFIQKK